MAVCRTCGEERTDARRLKEWLERELVRFARHGGVSVRVQQTDLNEVTVWMEEG